MNVSNAAEVATLPPWNRDQHVAIYVERAGPVLLFGAVWASSLLLPSVGLFLAAQLGLFIGVVLTLRLASSIYAREYLSRILDKILPFAFPNESFCAELNKWVFEAPKGLLSESKYAADQLFDAFNGKTEVTLFRCRRTTLPKCLARCTGLTSLELWECPNSVSIPAELGQWAQLRNLKLVDCTSLLGLPEAIFDLPSSCTIDIRNAGLSDAVLAGIGERVRQPGYHGPEFLYGRVD